MFNMKKKLFYLILTSVIGCSKVPSVDCSQKTRDSELAKCLIIGEWEFVKIERYFDERKTYYPKERGQKYMIKFKNNGKAEVSDDNWLGQYKYQGTIDYEFSPYSKWSHNPSDSALIVLFLSRGIITEDENQYPFFICDDTLHLDNEWRVHNGQFFFVRR